MPLQKLPLMIPSFGGARPRGPVPPRPGFSGKGILKSTGGKFGAAGGVGARGLGGNGLGRAGLKRHRKVIRDSIQGITKADIRRLARRGGVQRISGQIYEDARTAMVNQLKRVLEKCVVFAEHSNRRTVSVSDVIFALNRIGRPIYGFAPN